MSRDQGTVAEDSSLLDDSSSDPDQVVPPVAISFSYKPPKAISFSYRPPQLASSSTVTALTNSNHPTTNSQPPKTNAVPAKRNSELSQTNAGYQQTNSKHPKTTNSEPQQTNSSHDDLPPQFSSPSPDEMEVFDGDSSAKDEFPVVDVENQDGPKLIEHTTDPKLLERFLRRGRTDSVCRLITNIYDSDESGWSSDEGSSAPRIGMPIRSLGPRKGRSSSSSDLMVQNRPRVIPPGPPHRRSTTDILATPARRTAVGSRIAISGSSNPCKTLLLLVAALKV